MINTKLNNEEKIDYKNFYILNNFKEQLQKLQITKKVLFDKIAAKLEKISEMDKSTLHDYIVKCQNGKKFANYNGIEEELAKHIYKFRIDTGDRILYTYGKYIKYLPPEYQGKIILLAYSNHDNQASQSGFIETQDLIDFGLLSKSDVNITDDKKIGEPTNLDKIKKIFKNFSSTKYQIETADEFFIVNKDNIPEDNLELLDVLLSEDQAKLIKDFNAKNNPMVITGGAGTGKTILLSHIFHNFATTYKDLKSIYFTNSKLLLNNVTRKIKFIHDFSDNDDITKNKNVSFYDINNFLKEYLEKKINRNIVIIDYEQDFKNEFCNRINPNESLSIYQKFFNSKKAKSLERNEISIYQLWTEIRGCIKGGLNSEWLRTKPIDQETINKNILFKENYDNLIKYKLVIYDKQNQKYLFSDRLTNEFIVKKNNAYNQKNFEEIEVFNKLSNTYTILKENYRNEWEQNVVKEKRRDLTEYYNVMSEMSDMSNIEQKNACYKFCELYDDYFEKRSNESTLYLDDNDLARYVLNLEDFTFDLEGKFDLVIIDEVQDYTDTQVYLISKLAKKLILIAGDQHQIINPSFFHPNKLKCLPKIVENTNNNDFKIDNLGINFRSTSIIIKLLNNLIHYRRSKIGNMDISTEKDEKILDTKELLAIALKNITPMIDYNDAQSMENLFSTFKDRQSEFSYVAILVPDDETKNEMQNKWPSIKNMIFTISEIKGLEFQFVICCNMLSSNIETWKTIVGSKGKLKETKFRFIFNQLYVAISRAIKSITFIENFEKMSSNKDFSKIQNMYKTIIGTNIKYAENDMNWTEYITQFKIANNLGYQILDIENLIAINKYDIAIHQYQELKKSKECTNINRKVIDDKIKYCKEKYIEYLINERNEIDQSLKIALILNCKNILEKHVERIKESNNNLYRLIKIYINPEYLNLNNKFDYSNYIISDLYLNCFKDFNCDPIFINENDKQNFKKVFEKILEKKLLNKNKY